MVSNVHRNPILSRNDCPFIARFDIHRRGVLAALFACCVAWCRVKLLPSRHTLCVHHIIMHMFTVSLIWSHILYRVDACLAVTCHLHFGQNDRDFLRAAAVTRGGTDTEVRVSNNESVPWPLRAHGRWLWSSCCALPERWQDYVYVFLAQQVVARLHPLFAAGPPVPGDLNHRVHLNAPGPRPHQHPTGAAAPAQTLQLPHLLLSSSPQLRGRHVGGGESGDGSGAGRSARRGLQHQHHRGSGHSPEALRQARVLGRGELEGPPGARALQGPDGGHQRLSAPKSQQHWLHRLHGLWWDDCAASPRFLVCPGSGNAELHFVRFRASRPKSTSDDGRRFCVQAREKGAKWRDF